MRFVGTFLYKGMACAALALLLLATSGCATLNESECRTLDWQTLGYEDGGRGHALERIGQHRKACAKYGIAPDLAAYQRGRKAGLREYCRPGNGFRIGAAGHSYSGVCPADLEDEFLEAYESGQHLYELRTRVAEVEGWISNKQGQLEHAEDQLTKTSASVVSSDSTQERRAQGLLEAKRLAEEIGRLKSEIETLEEERAHRQNDVAAYRRSVHYVE